MVEDTPDDLKESISSAGRGDAGGWDQLVDRFAGVIWSIARRQGLSAADASEVSQTTWLRLAEHIGELKEPARIRAWITTTAKRESIRVGRLGPRHILVDPWEYLDRSADEDELDAAVLEHERDLAIQQAMALLSVRCREMLTALVLAEPPLSYAQVSEGSGVPIGSIGPTRNRCLEQLRHHLAAVEAGSEADPVPVEGLRR